MPPKSKELPQPIEAIRNGGLSLAIAYQGLRAHILERRVDTVDAQADQLDNDAIFFESLGHIASGVITEADDPYNAIDVNAPPTAPRLNALSGQAKSHSKMRVKRSAGIYNEDELARRGLLPPKHPALTPLARTVSPSTPTQLRAEQELADRVHQIRDGRKSQENKIKAFGTSGRYSRGLTMAGRALHWYHSRQALKDGYIDSYEHRDLKRARRGMVVKRNHPVVEKRSAELDWLSTTADTLRGTADRSRDTATALRGHRTVLHRRSSGRRTKQADLERRRARI